MICAILKKFAVFVKLSSALRQQTGRQDCPPPCYLFVNNRLHLHTSCQLIMVSYVLSACQVCAGEASTSTAVCRCHDENEARRICNTCKRFLPRHCFDDHESTKCQVREFHFSDCINIKAYYLFIVVVYN